MEFPRFGRRHHLPAQAIISGKALGRRNIPLSVDSDGQDDLRTRGCVRHGRHRKVSRLQAAIHQLTWNNLPLLERPGLGQGRAGGGYLCIGRQIREEQRDHRTRCGNGRRRPRCRFLRGRLPLQILLLVFSEGLGRERGLCRRWNQSWRPGNAVQSRGIAYPHDHHQDTQGAENRGQGRSLGCFGRRRLRLGGYNYPGRSNAAGGRRSPGGITGATGLGQRR